MMIDIEKVSAKDLTRIIAAKEGLDAANKARAKAQAEVDRCREVLRSLGVGLDGEMPADPTPAPPSSPSAGRVRKARPPRAKRVPRAPRGIDPAVVESVRTCLGDTLRSAPEIASITGLHVGVVRRVLGHLNATVTGQGRATRYHLPDGAPRSSIELPDSDPEDVDPDEPRDDPEEDEE